MANIAEDVKAIIVEKLGVDASEVTETPPLFSPSIHKAFIEHVF